MPLAASMQVSGIKGTGKQKGREGDITVVAFTHEVKADFDPLTGKSAGNRTHGPLIVSKNIDVSTPALRKAHADKSKLSVTLKLYHLPRSGPEFNYYAIHLSEARVIAINLVMPNTNTSELVHEYEEVSFAYKSIAYECIPPSEGLEKYSQYKVNDPEGALGRAIKFGPEWLEEKAKNVLKKLYQMAQDTAKREFAEEVKKADQRKDK